MDAPQAIAADEEDLELLRPFTSTPDNDLSESRSSASSMAIDDVPEGGEPVSTGPFNFQTQVMSTSPVKPVRPDPCGTPTAALSPRYYAHANLHPPPT